MSKMLVLFSFLLFWNCQSDNDTSELPKPVEEIIVTKVCKLPSEVYETSGILFHKGLLWTMNDSGNDPVLYAIDTVEGELVYEIDIIGADNIDWEAIGQDNQNIYIADNGNNTNSRDEYYIYVIDKDSISDEAYQEVFPIRTMSYTFSDNDLNAIGLNKTTVDSEALIVDGDSIYIYIKDWENYMTFPFSVHYEALNSKAVLGGGYDVGYAVTAATKIGNNQIAFLGYRNYKSFLTIIDVQPNLLNEVGEEYFFELKELQGYQTEGLTYANGKLYISCESLAVDQTLFRVDLK